MKRLSGEATASELTELEQLLRANPDLHYSVQPLMDIWQTDNSQDKATGREAFNCGTSNAWKTLGSIFRLLPGSTQSILLSRPPNGKDEDAFADRPPSLRPTALFSPSDCRPDALPVTIHRPASANSRHLPDNRRRALSEISTRNGSKTTLILPDGHSVLAKAPAAPSPMTPGLW